MPLDVDARTVLDLMAQVGAPPFEESTPAEARAMRADLAPPVLEPCHETRDLDAGGVRARLYRPTPGTSTPGLLVYFHGGGWVVGDLESHDNVCHALCRRSGQAVLSVDYRLAPEHPFPAGLDDCLHVVRWAHAHASDLDVDPDRLAVGGDSAGANLAAVVGHDMPVPLRLQLLVYPVTDLRMGTDSYRENAEGYFLTASGMRWFADHYLSGGATAEDPRVSPALADDATIAAGPPAVVITAGFDPLRDEGVAYVERLAHAGVRVGHLHYPGQIHGFFSMAHLIADARTALAAASQSVAEALAEDGP